MDQQQRALKKEVFRLMETEGVEDFAFIEGKKHPQLHWKHAGSWHVFVYSMSPRCDRQQNYFRSHAKRVIKDKKLGRH